MRRNNAPMGWKTLLFNALQLLFWVAFILFVVVGVKAPAWVKGLGWVLAAFYVVRAVVEIIKKRK